MPRPKKPSAASTRPNGSAKSKSPTSPTGEVANLEMQGDRLKVFSLQNLLTNKKSPETRATARLGDVLIPWFEKVVAKPAAQLGPVNELWQTLVPTPIQAHARLIGFSRGILSVALDSATTRAELEARLRAGLLRQLQTESRGTIFKVKTCVQPLTP